MTKLKEIKLKKFIETIKSEIPEAIEDNLKTFYEQNKEREVNIATKLAINQLKSGITSEYIVLGHNITRYKKQLIIVYDQKKREFKSITGAIWDMINQIKPLDKISIIGCDKSGIITATQSKIVGTYELGPEDITTNLKNITMGKKLILGHTTGTITIFDPIDWSTYEKGMNIAEAGRLSLYSNGLVNFSLGIYINDIQMVINFRDIPIRFFSDIIIPADLESAETLQSVLSMISFAIPVYITKEPENISDSNGKIITKVRAVGFGLLPLKSEPTEKPTSPSEPTEKEEDLDGGKNRLEIIAEQDLIAQAQELLNKFDTMTLEGLRQELGITEEAVFKDLIENICRKGIALLPDPDSIQIVQKKTEDPEDNKKEAKQNENWW